MTVAIKGLCDHIFGKSTAGGVLPMSIILSTLTFADGSLYFMITIKGKNADNTKDMDGNIFSVDTHTIGIETTFCVRYVKQVCITPGHVMIKH